MITLAPHQKEFVEFRGEYLMDRWGRGRGTEATTAICAKALHNAAQGEGTIIISGQHKTLIDTLHKLARQYDITLLKSCLNGWEVDGGSFIAVMPMCVKPTARFISLEADNVLIEGCGRDKLAIETFNTIKKYRGHRVKRLHTLL